MITNEQVLHTTPSERLRFGFGAEVVGEDGRLGTLHHLLLDADTGRTAGLAVRVGFLFPGVLRLPLGSVVSATAAEIRARLSSKEARALRRKQELLRRQDGAVSSLATLSAASRVITRKGRPAGRVSQLLVDARSGKMVELVVEAGRLSPRRWRLPGGWIRRITRAGIEVEATQDAIMGLPLFRSDSDLRADILDAWFYDERLRSTFLRAPVDVKVHEGLATLVGHVSARRICRRLEERARSVRGVLDVRNTITTDEELVDQVRAALGSDPRTSFLRPRITCSRGVISLEGEAPNRSVRGAASEVALTVPRVDGAINRLRSGQ